MEQEPTIRDILEVLIETSSKTDVRFDKIETRLDRHEETLQRITIVLVNIQERQERMDERLERLERNMTEGFGKMDQFLRIMQTHEAEIAALRSAYQRLDERVTALEAR